MRRNGRNAQSMVEFALVAPLFFILLMGVFDFGRAIFYYNQLAHAAREAARYAIVLDNENQTDVQIRSQAQVDMFTVLMDSCTSATPGDLCTPVPPASAAVGTVYVSVSPAYDARVAIQGQAAVSGSTRNYPVTVTLYYIFQPSVPVIQQLVGSKIRLSASSTVITQY
jgi:Flp pilus assembly protein TadG